MPIIIEGAKDIHKKIRSMEVKEAMKILMGMGMVMRAMESLTSISKDRVQTTTNALKWIKWMTTQPMLCNTRR
jgi:hypothetical protein